MRAAVQLKYNYRHTHTQADRLREVQNLKSSKKTKQKKQPQVTGSLRLTGVILNESFYLPQE